MLVRLNKHLRDSGLCSRRKADEFIQKGYVSVDGKVVKELGFRVDPQSCKISVSPEAHDEKKSFRYILLYKPSGYVATRSSLEGKTIFDLLPDIPGLTYSGRLDKDSEGLIILSDDGEFTYAVASPENNKEKEYLVELDGYISDSDLKKMEEGMLIDGKKTRPARCRRTGKKTYTIVLTEGMNRQVRKMAGKLHFNIVNLKRIRIGQIECGRMRPGEWRDLTSVEIDNLSGE